MKRLLSTSLVLALAFTVISSTSPFASALGLDIYDKIPRTIGTDIICENIALWDNGNYICITTKTTNDVLPYAPVQPQVIENFVHTITYSGGQHLATFETLVTGQVTDVSATILAVNGHFSNTSYTDLSYSTSISGNKATVYIKKSGVTIGTITYKITLDGTISQI